MEQQEVMGRVVKILTPWVKNSDALESVSMETNILEDLKVNSARLVDVVIAFEDDFDIEIADDDVDTVNTVGDAVNLIVSFCLIGLATPAGISVPPISTFPESTGETKIVKSTVGPAGAITGGVATGAEGAGVAGVADTGATGAATAGAGATGAGA